MKSGFLAGKRFGGARPEDASATASSHGEGAREAGEAGEAARNVRFMFELVLDIELQQKPHILCSDTGLVIGAAGGVEDRALLGSRSVAMALSFLWKAVTSKIDPVVSPQVRMWVQRTLGLANRLAPGLRDHAVRMDAPRRGPEHAAYGRLFQPEDLKQTALAVAHTMVEQAVAALCLRPDEVVMAWIVLDARTVLECALQPSFEETWYQGFVAHETITLANELDAVFQIEVKQVIGLLLAEEM